MISNIIRVIIASCIFTLLWFFIRGSYVSDSTIEQAKQHLWVHHSDELYILENQTSHFHELESSQEFSSAEKVNFLYNPNSLENKIQNTTSQLKDIVFSEFFSTTITELDVILHEQSIDVRWKMKAWAVLLYEVTELENSELIWVFIHELSHHIDIYSLAKKVFRDPSSDFYNISWENTTTLKSWEKIKDFVSGYAMSNKYEDFAESLTYYVFANEEMRQKSKNSFSIKQKYEFFESNLFRENEFKNTDFSINPTQRYYWDITKKWFDIEKFLQYLKKQI